MYEGKNISVIIATKNRVHSLNRLLDSIYKQTIQVDEIIIIDQSEENYESKILFKDDSCRQLYIHDPQITGLTQARNIGVNNSKGDFVFFFDDDLELLKDYVEESLQVLEKYPNIMGLCGTQITKKKRGKAYLIIRELFKKGPYSLRYKKNRRLDMEADGVDIRTKISGGITVYKREILREFRFDENLIKYCLGEDADFAYRVSKKYDLAITQKALSYHWHDTSGRLNYQRDFAARVCFYYYFFNKNCNAEEKKYLYWILLGLWLNAFALSAMARSLAPIKGIIDGLRFKDNNYVGSPCISISNTGGK